MLKNWLARRFGTNEAAKTTISAIGIGGSALVLLITATMLAIKYLG